MANQRTHKAQAATINGVSAGGLTTVNITKGYDNVISSEADGLEIPLVDKEIQFCRGSVTTQDITQAINLLTGEVGTFVFYEMESGVATYVKHTITNPVIHQVSFNIAKGGYATCSFNFECKAADATKGFADMHTVLREQASPDYVAANRGGHRVKTLALSTVNILHVTGISFSLALELSRACNDSDIGYTVVDAILQGYQPGGSIAFEDSGPTAAQDLSADILSAARGSLVATIAMAQGATDKVITIAGVESTQCSQSSSSSGGFTTYEGSYIVTNNTMTPLTLAGTNKIITIANAA